MTTVTASYEKLMDDAPATVAVYFNKAVEMVEYKFGAEFAQNNAGLIGALVNAMASDFSGGAFGKAIGEVADNLQMISGSLEEIANGINYIGSEMERADTP